MCVRISSTMKCHGLVPLNIYVYNVRKRKGKKKIDNKKENSVRARYGVRPYSRVNYPMFGTGKMGLLTQAYLAKKKNKKYTGRTTRSGRGLIRILKRYDDYAL